MTIEYTPFRNAALALFPRGTPVNAETRRQFEEAYHCKIEDTDKLPGLVPLVKFNTEQDEVMFLLKWS